MRDRFPIENGTTLIAGIMAKQANKEREFDLGRAVLGTKREAQYPEEVEIYRKFYNQANTLYSDILLYGYYLDYR